MPMPSNEALRNLLSNDRLDTFWDALWLELWPSMCFIVESRRIGHRRCHKKRGTISYRTRSWRGSGMACGSSYGLFCNVS